MVSRQDRRRIMPSYLGLQKQFEHGHYRTIGLVSSRPLTLAVTIFRCEKCGLSPSLLNLVVHSYFSVDQHIVYRTAKKDLPVLREQMRNVLVAEYPETHHGYHPESK